MSSDFFLRLKKLKTVGIIKKAASHNLREMYRRTAPPQTIDASKSDFNSILNGEQTAKGVHDYAEQLMKNAGITKVRLDAVRCIELVFSLPTGTQINLKEYFLECVSWAAQHFTGAENILSAVVHLDQSHPHCHVLILPIRNKRLIGSEIVGKRGNFREMHKSFKKVVGAKYQLLVDGKRATVANKRDLATQVLGALKNRKDAVLTSQVWDVLRANIEQNPEPYKLALGLQMQG